MDYLDKICLVGMEDELGVVDTVDNSRARANSDRRTCWVCFGTDEDDPGAKWINPCRCRGTTKWVHDTCLQRWFDEKQHGNPATQVFCPQCNTAYTISYPPLSPLLVLIDYGEKAANRVAPVAAAGAVVGSLYWSAVTFGAVTVMQILGHKEGLQVMEGADPLFLLVALPTIPLGLILGKMIRWEDKVLHLWREYSPKWEFLNKIFGGGEENNGAIRRQPLENDNQIDFVNSTRVLCGALMLPTFATAVGNYLFKRVQSPLKRTFMGGVSFIFVKGMIKIYYRQHQYVRLAKRKIEDFQGSTSV
ncbi:E3 ubiquitin-protein ligase MARCHF5-like [Clytia hemisphaerica]